MKQTDIRVTRELLDFIEESPTAFHAAENICRLLQSAGFTELQEGAPFQIVAGGRYYVTRNTSAVLAFCVPERFAPAFSVIASHTDSPAFKVKEHGERKGDAYTVLATEAYGGTILSTWLDRPLSVAGRAVLRQTECGRANLRSHNFIIDRDLLIIPNAAIHLQRGMNEGVAYRMNVDMQPLFSEKEASLTKLIAESMAVELQDIVTFDAYVYNRAKGTVFGADNEFFAAPRIDNLQCVYGSLQGFLQAKDFENIIVYAAFDNEETGSSTRMGAASAFFYDTLLRVSEALGFDGRAAIAASFMLSADNAHARHPNHPELYDGANAPVLNGGIVIKHQASQRYATEALSHAALKEIFARRGLPVQTYANRSDLPGGSTLGSIATTRVGMLTADVGMPQLAMHSAYETAGTADTAHLISAATVFYEADARCTADGSVTL